MEDQHRFTAVIVAFTLLLGGSATPNCIPTGGSSLPNTGRRFWNAALPPPISRWLSTQVRGRRGWPTWAGRSI